MARSAAMSAGTTLEEAAKLDPDEHPAELDEGRLVEMTRGTWRHGRITGNVVFALKLFARDHAGWSVATADPGTKLQRDPDVLRGPDVGIVSADREPKGKGVDGWLEGAPDVAVEVMGDDQTASQLIRKALEYIAAGAKAVWILDPDAAQVIVVRPPDHVRVLGTGAVLEGEDALPGFSCPVADLFQ